MTAEPKDWGKFPRLGPVLTYRKTARLPHRTTEQSLFPSQTLLLCVSKVSITICTDTPQSLILPPPSSPQPIYVEGPGPVSLSFLSDSLAQSLPHDLDPNHHHSAPGWPPTPSPVSCWAPCLLGGSLRIQSLGCPSKLSKIHTWGWGLRLEIVQWLPTALRINETFTGSQGPLGLTRCHFL